MKFSDYYQVHRNHSMCIIIIIIEVFEQDGAGFRSQESPDMSW